MSGEAASALDARAELALLAAGLRAEALRRGRRARRVSDTARPAPELAPTPELPLAAPARPSASPPPEAPGPAAQRAAAAACPDLESLRETVAACTACPLARTRTQTVFADGAPEARVMFVGEAPGGDEDRQGVPFVGRAGRLLTDIVEKGMGLARGDVYIANVLKCRPPENRDPTAEEKALCAPFLDRQIELLAPGVLIPLGRHAAGHLLGTPDSSMGRMRGRMHVRGGRKIVPTYHPAYLLRSPNMKRACWADIQLAMAELGLSPPGRGR